MVCRICGSKNLKSIQLRASHPIGYGKDQQYEYYICGSCGCTQIAKFPSYEDIYTRDYGSFAEEKPTLQNKLYDSYIDFSITGKGILGRMVSLIYSAGDYKFLRSVSREAAILDVGCGAGQLLTRMRRLGYKNIEGTEPFLSQDTVLEGGITLFAKDIADFEPQKKYDLIMLNMVLEHVENQQVMLDNIRRLLMPNGMVSIEIPIMNEYLWDTYGTSVWTLSPPEHLYIHSYKSIAMLAEKCGFEVVYWETVTSPLLESDFVNMKNGQLSRNINRNILQTVWCAVSTYFYRRRMDKKKMGNTARFILQREQKT